MSSPKLPLSNVRVGQRAAVANLEASGPMRRRLMDLGLTAGAQVECLHRSPWGDPAAYAIRGAVIALRDCDSAKISVIPLP